MENNILILGGGIGGLRTARELNSRLGNEDHAQIAKIIVFEKEEKNVFAPSLTWLMVGKRKEWQVERDLSPVSGAGIEFVFGELEKVDPENVTVTSGGKTYAGSHMVISLGAKQVVEHNLGNLGHNFYTVDGAQSFHEQLKGFTGGHIVVLVSSLPHKSPVAPYEAAMLIDNHISDKGLRDKTEISLISPESEPMRFAGKAVSENIKQLMEKRGINYLPEHQLTGTDGNRLHFKKSDGSEVNIGFDLLAFTPKHVCPDPIANTGLLGDTGWVDVDRETLQTKFDRVFAIGDITQIPLDDGEFLPKAGVFAQYQAHTVAHNIAREIYGMAPDMTFKAEGKYILDEGNGRASQVGGNFYSSHIEIKDSGMVNHWIKLLQEKSWFVKNF